MARVGAAAEIAVPDGRLFARPGVGVGQVQARLEVLAAHCAKEGTDFERIRKTVLWAGPVATDAAGGKKFAEEFAAYARIGIQEVHVMPWTGDPVGFIEGLGGHVIPRLEEL